MKIKPIILLGSILFALQSPAQSCRDLYKNANALFEDGNWLKAQTTYQKVVNCGDNFYVPDSKKKLNLIKKIIQKPNKSKPFSVSDSEIVIPYQGGQDIVTVDGNGSWTATLADEDQNWCTIKKNKGKVYIRSLANESNKERTCEIVISMGRHSRTVVVRNEQSPEILVPSVENVSFPFKGESNTVAIRANTDWKVTESPNWIEVSKDNGQITMKAEPNPVNKERKSNIKIESSSKVVIINIYQGAGLDHLAFSKNDLHFGPEGGDEYIRVYTDADEWRFGDFPHWCQVSKVADNLIHVHCTPNEPINLNREASVNVTTGKQTLGINVTQDLKPMIAVIPMSAIGGRPISLGFNVGFFHPMIGTSAGGGFTGSVVNYGKGNSEEEASYTAQPGFTVGAFADIRVYKNLYLKAGLNYSQYGYENGYFSNVERNVLANSNKFYLRGVIMDQYKEKYKFHQLDLPILLSYRFPVTTKSHIQINAGPVFSYGLSANMTFSGTSDGENLEAYKIINHNLSDERVPGIEALPHHIKCDAEFDLYKKNTDFTYTYTENTAIVNKSSDFDAAPFKRFNVGGLVGVSYELMGVSLSVDYQFMLTNMANKRYWESNRWMPFDQPGVNMMSGYSQRNHGLHISMGYTFRY